MSIGPGRRSNCSLFKISQACSPQAYHGCTMVRRPLRRLEGVGATAVNVPRDQIVLSFKLSIVGVSESYTPIPEARLLVASLHLWSKEPPDYSLVVDRVPSSGQIVRPDIIPGVHIWEERHCFRRHSEVNLGLCFPRNDLSPQNPKLKTWTCPA